eukprot:6361949-Pyramimonas_sp.AAC.1
MLAYNQCAGVSLTVVDDELAHDAGVRRVEPRNANPELIEHPAAVLNDPERAVAAGNDRKTKVVECLCHANLSETIRSIASSALVGCRYNGVELLRNHHPTPSH